MNVNAIREKYLNKQFVISTNTDRTVDVIDIDEIYMTVKIINNRYSRDNCCGDYSPYNNDIVKYPLTNLPILYLPENIQY